MGDELQYHSNAAAITQYKIFDQNRVKHYQFVQTKAEPKISLFLYNKEVGEAGPKAVLVPTECYRLGAAADFPEEGLQFDVMYAPGVAVAGGSLASQDDTALVTVPDLYDSGISVGDPFVFTPGEANAKKNDPCGAIGCWTYYSDDKSSALGTAKITAAARAQTLTFGQVANGDCPSVRAESRFKVTDQALIEAGKEYYQFAQKTKGGGGGIFFSYFVYYGKSGGVTACYKLGEEPATGKEKNIYKVKFTGVVAGPKPNPNQKPFKVTTELYGGVVKKYFSFYYFDTQENPEKCGMPYPDSLGCFVYYDGGGGPVGTANIVGITKGI